ncbi:Pkinase-domain-containing protein [Hesseltinella vesiculosa]|uniref:Cyclin-dependent kinase 1 n=1 Tax=Hesseltinella vesiculosa TaxID=101127 RepID=A0A1X2GWT1_9FUNG|nr:Pkinase-domain-containing protein [Hesseltinella vesiculosa]
MSRHLRAPRPLPEEMCKASKGLGNRTLDDCLPLALLTKEDRVQEMKDKCKDDPDTTNVDGSKDAIDERREERDIIDQGYTKMGKIGEGTYGEVFRAIHKATNSTVALKRVHLHISHGGISTTALREIALLKEIKHKNVLRLRDLIYRDTNLYLVFDYSDVDLRRYIEKVGRPGLTYKHIKSFTHQILSGLQYIHSHRILHRDLKPQNILINRSGMVTIADFGLSRSFGVPMRAYTHNVITLWYRAPEILLGGLYYSTAVDMWSVGCIMIEMATLAPAFPGDSQIDELFNIFQFLGTPDENVWPGISTYPCFENNWPPWKRRDFQKHILELKPTAPISTSMIELIESLLTYDPANRISAKAAEAHEFFFDDISMLHF